jgi:hypothetical protein
MAYNYPTKGSYVGSILGAKSKAGIFNQEAAQLYGDGLFPFDTFTFQSGVTKSRYGPSLSGLLALNGYSSQSWTSNTDYFNVIDTGIQLWTVPKSGTYRILAAGAQGGNHASTSYSAYPGGSGATMQGDFDLLLGDKIQILVGSQGKDQTYSSGGGTGGGGGSFVVKENGTTNSDILVIAGGGGGMCYWSGRGTWAGGSGLTGTTGGTSTQTSGTYGNPAPNYTSGGAGDRSRGGANGYGGGGAVGGGGGGFFDRGGTGNGGATLFAVGEQSGKGFLAGTGYTAANRGQGGDGYGNGSDSFGGYGGGGGAQDTTGYGGGGGGYSGGGGGMWTGSLQGNGGGGGSYNNGSNQSNTAGANQGEGYVTITLL